MNNSKKEYGWHMEVLRHSDLSTEYVVSREPPAAAFLLSQFYCAAIAIILVSLLVAYFLGSPAVTGQSAVKYLPPIIAFTVMLVARWMQRNYAVRESVLVLKLLGVQISTDFLSGRQISSFLPDSAIETIVINEGISMHRIIFYLALVTRKNGSLERLVPLFMNSNPRLPMLKLLYVDMRESLNRNHSSGLQMKDL